MKYRARLTLRAQCLAFKKIRADTAKPELQWGALLYCVALPDELFLVRGFRFLLFVAEAQASELFISKDLYGTADDEETLTRFVT